MELDCHTMIYSIVKIYEFADINDDEFWRDTRDKRKLRILGEYFCRNNKNKGKLIINNKKSEIK